MSKSAEGWIRHRGGKCPVEAGGEGEIRLRDGSGASGCISDCRWSHTGGPSDIMAYKLHKPAEQAVKMEAFSECVNTLGDSHADVMESVLYRLDGPLQWRDRITEIDATTKALTAECADLVQKLASEGFALIGRPTDSAAVLPRDQWKVGDLVVRVSDGEESGMPLNEPMKITFFDGSNRGQDVEVGGKYFPNFSSLLWHSRPSA